MGQPAKSLSTFSGKVFIKLYSCTGIPGKKIPDSDVFVEFRVDGSQKARSKASRGKFNEDFVISVDKARELEISLYESDGQCLSLVWFSFLTLAEAMVGLARASGSLPKDFAQLEKGDELKLPSNILGPSKMIVIDSHLEMEPSGRIHLKLNLGKCAATYLNCCRITSNAGQTSNWI